MLQHNKTFDAKLFMYVMLKHNYPFKAVIAGIVVFVFQLVNNVLQGLRLTLFLKEVTQ